MQANPNEVMDEQYRDLTEKQRAVIDAHAKNPDATNREKARIAGEDILGQDSRVNESYCSEILNDKNPDLAEYRAELEQNERPTGQEQIIGDPFEQLQDQDDESWQSIQERPTKEGQQEIEDSVDQDQELDARERSARTTPKRTVGAQRAVQVGDAGNGIVVKFSYPYVRELLESQEIRLPDELHQKLVDVVLERAFN